MDWTAEVLEFGICLLCISDDYDDIRDTIGICRNENTEYRSLH